MKKIVLILIICTSGLRAVGQQGPARVTDLKVERVKSAVEVRCLVAIAEKAAARDHKLTLTPLLYSGVHSAALTPVVVQTRHTQINDFRTRTSLPSGALATRSGQTVQYAASVPYEGWMDGASLRMECTLAGCGHETDLAPVAMGGPFGLRIEPVAAVQQKVTPKPRIEQAARKWEFSKKEMIVGYPLNRTEVDLSLLDNRSVLDEIVQVVRKLRADPSTPLNRIDITGYASPEGRTDHNVLLAGRRAESLRTYLQQQQAGLSDGTFTLTNGGEDWAGLRELVAASDKPWRRQVLDILEAKQPDMKRRLQQLDGGGPYRYMLAHYYPGLRNACYISVWYDTVGDTAADRINEALQMIRDKQYDQALGKLLPLQGDRRAWNPIGVCYMMTDRTAEAKTWLQKAADAGDASALENLAQIAQNE